MEGGEGEGGGGIPSVESVLARVAGLNFASPAHGEVVGLGSEN